MTRVTTLLLMLFTITALANDRYRYPDWVLEKDLKQKKFMNTAEVTQIYGRVFLEYNDERISMKKGDRIHKHDRVVTMANSQVIIQLPDKSMMRLGPNTNVTFRKLVAMVDDKTIDQTSIVLLQGHVMFDVKNEKKEPILEVRTRPAVIGTRGTRFWVGYDREPNNLWVSVSRGEVEINNRKDTNEADIIEAGFAMVVYKHQFSQQMTYNWQEEIQYRFKSMKFLPDTIAAIQARHMERVLKMKKAWKRDERRWRRKSKEWYAIRKHWQAKQDDKNTRRKVDELFARHRGDRVEKFFQMTQDDRIHLRRSLSTEQVLSNRKDSVRKREERWIQPESAKLKMQKKEVSRERKRNAM